MHTLFYCLAILYEHNIVFLCQKEIRRQWIYSAVCYVWILQIFTKPGRITYIVTLHMSYVQRLRLHWFWKSNEPQPAAALQILSTDIYLSNQSDILNADWPLQISFVCDAPFNVVYGGFLEKLNWTFFYIALSLLYNDNNISLAGSLGAIVSYTKHNTLFCLLFLNVHITHDSCQFLLDTYHFLVYNKV